MIRPSVLASGIAAAAALTAGCGDQFPAASFDLDWASPSATPRSNTNVIEVRGETVYARLFSETGCEFRDVVVVGSENAQLAGGPDAFGDLALLALEEGDNCLSTSSRWIGVASTGFAQSGLTWAKLSTPITLENEDTGETRSLTLNFELAGTDSVVAELGHFTDLSQDQRLVAYFSVNSRSAKVTTAELMESETNLLDGAQLGFASLANARKGSITIAYQ
ncbi:MAG TPA: hypothetical protein VH763_09760 [Gemmatimonadales bacterium]|jgi:hypothetical protein